MGLCRDIAIQADDSKLAFDAIDRIAEKYEVEPLAMKSEALAALTKVAKGRAGHKALAAQSLELAREALKDDKLDAAADLAKLAQSEAGKARDKEIVLNARNLSKEVEDAQKAFAEVEPALARLKQSPGDPYANLAVGQYYALVRHDWNRGLPFLAKGSDEPLRALAAEDLKHATPDWKPAAGVPPPHPVAANIAMKLADGWWDFGRQGKGKGRDGSLWRAGFWYEEVRAGTGPDRPVLLSLRVRESRLGPDGRSRPVLFVCERYKSGIPLGREGRRTAESKPCPDQAPPSPMSVSGPNWK